MKSREYLRGEPKRIKGLFREYPYVAAWCVTQAINEEYGDQDQAIYRHIEDALAVNLDVQPDRRLLFQSFCRVCEKLGLPTRGFNRMVDLYLLHAGVPLNLLPSVISGFLRQEAAFGPPPTQSTVLLNRWEDDSLHFMRNTLITPRRAIQWDETAWHATLYARIRSDRNGFVPNLPIEERFAEVLSELEQNIGSRSAGGKDAGSISSPNLQLIWSLDGLTIRVPRVEGRVRLWKDDDDAPFRLRGGEDWILSQPWPALLRWKIGDSNGELRFLSSPEEVAVFDRTTGHLVKVISGRAGEIEVDSSDAVILSRGQFSVDGMPASEIASSGFVAVSRLGISPVELETGTCRTKIRTRLRRRLKIRDGQVASGPQGTLYGPSAVVEVETGFERDEARMLRITLGEREESVEVAAIQGFAEIGMEQLLSSFQGPINADPSRMRIDLLAPAYGTEAPVNSGVSLQVWVWPAYSGTDGLVYMSDPPPRSLVLEQSQHITVDIGGRLALDRLGGYLTARVVFEIDGAFLPFNLPWPDVVVTRRRHDDSEFVLPIGSRLTIDEQSRFDTLKIRCPDPRAILFVRGRREDSPFERQRSRTLAIRDLLEPAADNSVVLRRGNGNELPLFELVPTIEPNSVRSLPTHEGVRLRLDLMRPVDALALELVDEHGKTEFVEASLGRRPVSTRCPSWLKVDLPNDDPTEVELTASEIEFTDGNALARIFLRPEVMSESDSRWHPLRSSRGDTYALTLGNPDRGVAHSDLPRRFRTLSKWLADCYAADSWEIMEGPLTTRWKDVGTALFGEPGGKSAMMAAGAILPPDHTSLSWIPDLHPIHLFPGLYSVSTSAFAGLSGASDPGVTELAKLFSLGWVRLRDQSQLHVTVYLAFRNRQQAKQSDEPLSGFEPHRFFSNLPLVDNDKSAGWFWRGTPVLGPDHWRSAHTRLVERLEIAEMFTGEEAVAGANSRRQVDLQRLSRVVWEMTPVAERPPVPHRSGDSEEPHNIDLWFAACLSAFGRASRMGEVDHFLEVLKERLGWSEAKVLSTLAMMLRLAPEFFAFFLLVWQIAKDRP